MEHTSIKARQGGLKKLTLLAEPASLGVLKIKLLFKWDSSAEMISHSEALMSNTKIRTSKTRWETHFSMSLNILG